MVRYNPDFCSQQAKKEPQTPANRAFAAFAREEKVVV